MYSYTDLELYRKVLFYPDSLNYLMQVRMKNLEGKQQTILIKYHVA